MHVKAKIIAFGGLLLALTVLFMMLGGIIETNTLFLLAAASYFAGIMIRETGLRMGAAFYLAGVLLGFFLVPNKFMYFPMRLWDSTLWRLSLSGERWGTCLQDIGKSRCSGS